IEKGSRRYARDARELLDRHIDDGGLDRADAEGLRWVHLDTKIVSAGTETVKVDKGIDRSSTKTGQRFPPSASGDTREDWLDRGRQTRLQVAPTDRHASKLQLYWRRQNIDRNRRVLRLHQVDRRIRQPDGDNIPYPRAAPGDLNRLCGRTRQLFQPTLRSRNLDGGWIRRHPTDHKSRRRLAVQGGHDGHGAMPGCFQIDGECC